MGISHGPGLNFDSSEVNIQMLTAHEGKGAKLLSRGETQPWPTIH